jgi:hypothetical protein
MLGLVLLWAEFGAFVREGEYTVGSFVACDGPRPYGAFGFVGGLGYGDGVADGEECVCNVDEGEVLVFDFDGVEIYSSEVWGFG